MTQLWCSTRKARQHGTPSFAQYKRNSKSCQPTPSCPTGSIQSLAAAQSHPTCPDVASPIYHGQCNCGEPTPLWPTHPMLSKPHHPIGQPVLSWPIRFIEAIAGQSNRRQANPSRGHTRWAKPGQDQARPDQASHC